MKNIKPPAVGEKAEKLLFYLSEKNSTPGKIFTSIFQIKNINDYLPYCGICWAIDKQELDYLFHGYLNTTKQFILNTDGMNHSVKISPTGWAYLDSLQQINPDSHLGFVAMWFDPKMNSLHQSIEKAIHASGYEPKRIDRLEHNNKIDDEIIAMIRKSRFAVYDFTGQRGGVYFEAGYALGLGLPVIWLCKETEINNIHFDNRQYNFILWNEEHPEDLRQRLQNRIEATLGPLNFEENPLT
ncbi:MAG: hypothetical protein JW774_07990 [Candidatus Aureabacteria bacterium]|nr:hypothetical protein [Candidatus Auribacterota bacterium]